MTVGGGASADIESATSVPMGPSEESAPQDGGPSKEQTPGRANGTTMEKIPVVAADGELGRGIPGSAHGAPFPPVLT